MSKHLTDHQILKAVYNAKKKYYFEFLIKSKKEELPNLGMVGLHIDDFVSIEKELGISKNHFVARLNCINERYSTEGLNLAFISNYSGFEVQVDFPMLDGIIAKLETDKHEHTISRMISFVGIAISVVALIG